MKTPPFLVMVFSSSGISALFLGGCSTAPTSGSSYTERYWTSDYAEIWVINTEPTGARVYLSGSTGDILLGTAPIQTRVGPNKITVRQGGTEQWEIAGGGRRDWTEWAKQLRFDDGGFYTIRAFGDGNSSSEVVVRYSGNDPLLRSSIDEAGLPDDKGLFTRSLPERTRHLLIRLSGSTVENPNERGTSARDDAVLAEARREYDEALAAYQKAEEKAQQVGALTGLSDQGYAMGNVNPALALLGRMSNSGMRAEALRDLEAARDRLERAKARLNALNYRY